MSSLRFSLFGPFQLSVVDQPLTFPTERSRALLAYLALHPHQPQQRKILAELLWDDRIGSDSLTNLRTELSRLRRSLDGLESALLETDRNTITFVGDEHMVDALQFRALLRACQQHPHAAPNACAECARRMEAAMALYQAPFLKDFYLDGNIAFDEWLLTQREIFQQQAMQALEWLMAYHQRQHKLDAVIRWAQRQIELAPWLESAHEALMRAYLLTGERHQALRHYETMVQTLATEMDAPPSLELQQLYAQMRAGTTRTTVATPPPNPYRGLKAFDAEHADHFFGREKNVTQIVDCLVQEPLLMVVGASGSGKSSLLHAGVAPTLSANQEWRVISLRPGADPFSALANVLVPRLPEGSPLIDRLRQGPFAWCDLSEALQAPVADLAQSDSKPCPPKVLIMLDQFEELFSLCTDVTMRQHFLDLLVDAIEQQPAWLALLLALRADFLGQVLSNGRFADAIGRNLLALGAMTRAEMAQAVQQPAHRYGVHFEPGLVERLLDDVGNDAGRLPLLQFTLTRLWQEQRHGWITHEAYEALEEVAGALNHYADGILARLQPHQQLLAQRIFLRLVQVLEGVEDSRRVGLRREFNAEEWAVVQTLADARLLVTDQVAGGEEGVELVHEALIHDWQRLRTWLHADRAFRLWQGEIRLQAQQWERSGNDEATLLRGAPLAEAERWGDDRREDLPALILSFITASRLLRQQREVEQEAQRQRELAQIRQVAEAEGQRAEAEAKTGRRLRAFLVGLALMLVLALVLARYALIQEQRAVEGEVQAQAEADARATEVAVRVVAEERALAAQAEAEAERALAAPGREIRSRFLFNCQCPTGWGCTARAASAFRCSGRTAVG